MSSSSNLMDRGTVQMQLQPEMLRMLMQQQISSGGADVGLGIGVQMSGDVAPEHSSGSRSEDGRSRKYREGGWELTGQMAGLPRSLISTPNPVVPLKFEQPPGKWQAMQIIITETHNIAQFTEYFVSAKVMRAHIKALEAYGCTTWQEAVQTAQQALSLSPTCPEAYNVLAVAQATTYEEALELYRKAVELGPQVLQPFCFHETMEEHTCWQRTPFRAYYRGLYGVANTLRKMGRYAESLSAYEKLLAADPSWYNWSSYVNVMALYPFVLLGAKGPKAVIQYMRDYRHTSEHFVYISSNVYWVGAYVLADMMATEAKGSSVKAEGAKMTAEDNWAADGMDLPRLPPDSRGHEYNSVKCRPLFCFCHTFFEAVDMLLGDKALPPGLSPICTGSGKTMASASFAYTTGAQWRSSPSILDRLRRYRNTYEVRALVQDMRSGKVQVDLQELRHYMKAPGGFHTGALERETGPRVRSLLYTLTDHPDGKEFNKDELKVLKWLLDAEVPVTNTHPDRPNDQPLHMACYQGYGPEAVRLLIAAGADPMLPNKEGLSALAMTANQGNWREMQAVLQAMPHLHTANAAAVRYCEVSMPDQVPMTKLSVPDALLLDLFSSSCLLCLTGGPKCMRCSNGIPHSKHADFFKFAEVLIAEVDMRKLSKPVLDDIKGTDGLAPTSPWRMLYKVVLKAIEQQSKAQTSPKQQQPPAAAAGSTARGSSGGFSSSSSSNSEGVSANSKGKGPEQQQQQQPPPSSPPPPAAAGGGLRQCGGCGVQAGADRSLQKCGGCKRVYYCSRQCQEAAWKGHKADCKKWAAEKAAAKAQQK